MMDTVMLHTLDLNWCMQPLQQPDQECIRRQEPAVLSIKGYSFKWLNLLIHYEFEIEQLLGPCSNSIDVVAVAIAVVYVLIDMSIGNHVVEFYTVSSVVVVWRYSFEIMNLAIHLAALPVDLLRRSMLMPIPYPNS